MSQSDRERAILAEFLGEPGMRPIGWQVVEQALRQHITSRTAILVGVNPADVAHIARMQAEIRLLTTLLQEPERFLLPIAGKQSNNG